MVAVSCEYLLAVIENLEFVFSEQVEAGVVVELPKLIGGCLCGGFRGYGLSGLG